MLAKKHYLNVQVMTSRVVPAVYRYWLRCLVASILLVGSKSHAASFDCQKARNAVEQLICLDPQLSAADERMAGLYSRAVNAAEDPRAVRQSQRDWLRLVRNRCDGRECLVAAYAERIRRLEANQPLNLADTPAQPSSAAGLKSGDTVYLDTSAEYEQKIAAWLQQTKPIEVAMQVVQRYVTSSAVPVVFVRHCGAQAGGGAWYLETANQIHVCYEFIASLLNAHDAAVKAGGTSWEIEQRLVLDGIKFLVWHEAAHGLLRRDGGSTGPEEAAADNIAAILLLTEAKADEDVRRAVLAVHRLTSAMGPRVTYTDTEYADEHLLPQQRFFAVACLAVGREPALSGWLTILSPRRAAQCKAEWPRKVDSLNALLKRIR